MCIECDLNAAHQVYLCVPCRKVWKHNRYMSVTSTVCSRCGVSGRNMGFRWRAPKLSNEKAWKLIEKGDFLWDKRAIAKSRRAQAKLADEDRWANESRLTQRKPKGILPKNWRRKFLK